MTRPVSVPTRRVLIDTDVDIDDWMAILFLLQFPGIEVAGLTTTGCGAAHLTPGTKNLLNLLELAGHPTIPVARGTNAPLVYSNQFPADIRQGVDTVFGLPLPANPNPPSDKSAASLLSELLHASPGKTSILAIGGLTNLAMLFRQDPSAIGKIERIWVMGGAVRVPGNVYVVDNTYLNKVAEWNIFLDVLGAKIVFESGVPITLVPLDASQHVPLDIPFYERIAARHVTPSANFVFQALTADIDFVKSGQFFFWDPLAAGILADPTLARTEEMRLRVVQELDEEDDRSGQLVSHPHGSPITVAMWADGPRFTDLFLDTLNRSA